MTGKTIGNYRIVQPLGEGGMGIVYLAEHPVIGRKVAIKLLHMSFARDADVVARFFNEARAIHMIGHENIVEILDFGHTGDGQPYFIMEYLAGGTLAERVEKGPIPLADTTHIADQICSALQAAHDKSIIHRDLKPHNVYLVGHDERPDVKILDFGVAKMVTGWDTAQSGGQSVKTRTGSLMGTPLYMSPEQCRGSGKLDHRTDIYSLGVIVFEMLAGRPPFMAEGVGELFAKHMLEPAPSLAEFAPQTPPHVVAAIARALAKNLEDRFPSMNAFRDALIGKSRMPADPLTPERYAKTTAMPSIQGSSAAGLPSVQSTTLSSAVSELGDDEDLMPRPKRGKLLVAALGVLLVAGGAGVFVMKSRRPPPAPAAPPPVVETPPPPEPPAPPPEPETVDVRLEAEPAAAHVLRKPEGDGEPQDVGETPLDLKLPRDGGKVTYILRAEGFKDRTVAVDLSRGDQVLHFPLARVAPPKAKPEPRPKTPPKPKTPKRPVIHDSDGLAVPKF